MDELSEEAKRFQSQLIGSDPEQFAATKLDDLSQDLLIIQSQRDATKEMMSMNRLQLFMDYMTDFEDTLIELGFQEAKQVMSYVWGSVRYLLKRTNPTEKAFDNILDTYELLGVSLIKVSDYTSFFRDVPAAREYLVNIYKDVQHFHSLAYKLFFTFRAKLWQKLHKPIWKDHKTTFNHIAESLSLHASKIQGYGKAFRDPDSYRTGAHERRTDSGIDPNPALNPRQVKEDISNYHVALNKLREEFEETEKKRKREMKNSTIAWISSSTEIEKLQDDFRRMRICKNTGRWLFRRNRGVSEWLTAEGGNEGSLSQSAIWLHGNRGFGKTILTSLVIDELEDLRQREDQPVPKNSKTYYFYCQEEDPELRTYLEILKGILCQMVKQDDYIVPLCHDKMTQGGCTSLSEADTAKSLIETIVQYNPRQYIIIDGLDEFEAAEIRQTAEFFTKLVELCDNANEHGQLRLMIMSREVPEIKKYMTDDDAIIALRPTDNAEDIKAYVRKRLPEFSESDDDMGFNLSRQQEDSIESLICRRSEDSFLYAHLAIESLLQHITKGDLLKEIKEDILPEELGAMYEMLLGNLEKKIKEKRGGARMWEKSKLLLGWLVCAKRPLKWHEMQAILSFDAEKAKVDFDHRMLKNDVRRYLGSIVHVLDGDHIRLIHTTARRHIISNKHIDEKKVQCELTSLCLRYLSLPCFTRTYASTLRRDQAKAGWFSFQDYACSKWDSHIDTFIRECSSLFDGPAAAWGKEQRDFDGALELFMKTHGEEIRADLHENFDTTHLENFEGTTFSESLRTLWNRIYIHHKSKDEEKNKVGIPQINTSLLENRAVLEELAPDDDAFGKRHIKDLYGLHLFKCRRTLCRYFYVGYDSEAARKNHENRHDRPFPCPLSCNSAPIGFSTNKDKDRHVRIYHPELAEGPSMFDPLSRRQATGQARFKCHICDKNFTRKINLSGHERSHYGDRPYQCSICDRGFARMNDCRRHEKIHKKDK